MKRLLAVILLAGCTAPLDPVAPIAFRNPTAQVASQADVTLERLAGEWRIVSIFDDAQFGAVRQVRFDGPNMALNQQLLPVTRNAQGRLTAGGQQFWVHWLDINNRTAVIGSPDGRFGWIMDRNGTPSPDRLKAAREILEWYGYDLSRMKDV
ncbi:lipocalin family protein [Algirhabdus cladophorae]|uniref:lipocalin family protein n=1 Tax=Algirhabdus cladophorae TaxID=3377108 RepID=UPI003B8451E1